MKRIIDGVRFGAVGWVLALALTTTAMAGAHEVVVPEGTQFDGTALEARRYTVVWKPNGTPDTVDVWLRDGHRVVAKATGIVVDRDAAAAHDAVVIRSDGEGGYAIREIRFARQTRTIRIGT